MPLNINSLSMLGRFLSVRLINGYGWGLRDTRTGDAASKLVDEIVGAATKCRMEYMEPTFVGEQLAGGLGCVMDVHRFFYVCGRSS